MTLPVSPVAGRTDILSAHFVDFVKPYEITPADLTANVYNIAVPLGARVLEVRGCVLEEFDGTSPTVKVGDSDDDGFLETDDLDLETAGSMVSSFLRGDEDGTSGVTTPNAYARGKAYLTAPGIIKATFAGSPTVGRLLLEVKFAGYPALTQPRDMINNW